LGHIAVYCGIVKKNIAIKAKQKHNNKCL